MKLRILKSEYHRNGVGGAGFYAVLFTDSDYPYKTFIASLFEEKTFCSVFCLEELVKSNIQFGSNSWRGDVYEYKLRPLLEEFKKRAQ